MALDIQFVDSTGTVQAILPLESEVFATLQSILDEDGSALLLSRLSGDTDAIWTPRETSALHVEVSKLLSKLPEYGKPADAKARDFLWRFEQFLQRAELQSFQVRALAE